MTKPRVVIVVESGVGEVDSRFTTSDADVFIVDIDNLRTIGYGWTGEHEDHSECAQYIRDEFPPDVAEWAIKQVIQDACQICHGSKGGVRGNENIVDGVVMCDYCHAERMKR